MSLRIVSANTDWAKRRDGSYLLKLAESADVILTQESKDTDLAKEAPAGWTVLQSTRDAAHMGTGILIRDTAAKVVTHDLYLGCRPFIGKRRIRMLSRYINTARLELSQGGYLFVVSAHFPPKRFSPLQPIFAFRLKRIVAHHRHAVVGTDANQPIGFVATRLGFRAHGKGIVGLLTAPGVKVADLHVRYWGIRNDITDHPSVEATCTPINPGRHSA
jgi:hypothetical protein